jgi:hypothetical protein
MATEDIKQEEEKQEQQEEQNQEQEQQEDPSVELENRAREMGWRPKTEFHGDDDDFIDAKEFINRKPLFDKIEAQGKQLKDALRALNNLKSHYTMVRETEYERALKALKAQRSAAIKEGDGEAFEELDGHIRNIEREADGLQELKKDVPETPQIHPEFQSWLSRNSWYNRVGYMRQYADELGARLHAQGKSPPDVLKEVAEAVREEFKDKFRNPNKDSAPRVDSGVKGSGTGGKSDNFELTPQEKKVMNDFLRMKNPDGTPFMTREQYISDLKRAKGVE